MVLISIFFNLLTHVSCVNKKIYDYIFHTREKYEYSEVFSVDNDCPYTCKYMIDSEYLDPEIFLLEIDKSDTNLKNSFLVKICYDEKTVFFVLDEYNIKNFEETVDNNLLVKKIDDYLVFFSKEFIVVKMTIYDLKNVDILLS